MSTVDSVFLIITGSTISLFFIMAIVVLIYILKFIKNLKRVIEKAEDAVETVEAATETIKNIGKNASGPMAIIKVIANIMRIVNRK